MARLSSQIITLRCTSRAQKYFSSGERKYLLATLECAQGVARAEYAPLIPIHEHDVFYVKAMLDKLTSYELDMFLALDQSLHCFELAKIFKKKWRYPLSWVLSCLFYNLNLRKNVIYNNKIKLSALIINNIQESYGFIRNNYTCLKIKIGDNLEEQIIKISELRARVPTWVKLRLDANRRLSLEDAGKIIRALTPEAIEYFEEPVARPQQLSYLFDNYGVSLALDESWNEASTWDEISSSKARYVIIKPSRFSSIYEVMTRAAEALERNITPILSTCFESSYSAALFALVAADLGLLDHAHGIWAEGFFDVCATENPFVNAPGHIYLSQAQRYLDKLCL